MLNKSPCPDPLPLPDLCSSRITLRNESNCACSFFIFFVIPYRSSQSSARIKSPILNSPANTINSTTISLNSSAFGSPPPLPSPNTLRPNITRTNAFVVHILSN
ncbi:hypothetical protein Hdeb2414_s0022g00617351 [Helianthus debilis subsp. tardiflorus]